MLLKQSLKNTSWVGGFRISSRLVAFLKLAILARLLTPEQFGVYGVAVLVLAFVEIFTETGINTVLIQEKRDIGKYIDTAWTISMIRGVLISFMIFATAPIVAQFFNSEASLVLLRLISLVPLIRGFINPSVVKFHKELRFDKEFWFRIAIFCVDAFVAVVFAVVTKNPTALVFGFIAGAVLEVALSFVLVSPRPSFKFRKGIAKQIIARGKWMTGIGIFQYLFRQGDDVVVGKFLGSGSLGIYQAAYKLSTLPVSEIADVVSKVAFPTFVKITDNPKRLKKIFYQTLLAVVSLSILLAAFISLFSETIVLILLGRNWLEVVPILKILVVFGVLKAFTGTFHSIFLATQKQQYVTSLTFVSTVFLFIAIFPLLFKFGLTGVAYATIIGSFAAVPVSFYYLRKLFKEI